MHQERTVQPVPADEKLVRWGSLIAELNASCS